MKVESARFVKHRCVEADFELQSRLLVGVDGGNKSEELGDGLRLGFALADAGPSARFTATNVFRA